MFKPKDNDTDKDKSGNDNENTQVTNGPTIWSNQKTMTKTKVAMTMKTLWMQVTNNPTIRSLPSELTYSLHLSAGQEVLENTS